MRTVKIIKVPAKSKESIWGIAPVRRGGQGRPLLDVYYAFKEGAKWFVTNYDTKANIDVTDEIINSNL